MYQTTTACHVYIHHLEGRGGGGDSHKAEILQPYIHIFMKLKCSNLKIMSKDTLGMNTVCCVKLNHTGHHNVGRNFLHI